MMIKNKLKFLKKENDNISRWMNDEDENLIDSIIESLGIFRVNSFDAQIIRRDLIGMAEEARLRGSNMKEVIGDDIRLTSYEIIRNSRGSSKHEIVFLYLKYLFGIVFSLIGFYGSIITRSLTWNVNIMGLFSLVLSTSMFFLLAKLVRPLLNMEGWGRFGYYWTLLTALSLSTPAIYAAYSGNLIAPQRISVPGWIVLSVSGLLYLVSDYYYRRTINKLAMDNSNYFEDLIDEN